MSLHRKLETFATEQVSSRPLALVRVFVPLTITFQFASPWVTHRMDDVTGAMLLGWLMFASCWGVLLGIKTRISAAVLALAFAGLHFYYGFELGDARFTEPILVLQAVVLLAITPCGRSLSIDRGLEVRRARAEGRAPPPERMHRWQLELFVLHLALIHLWGAIDMSDAAWLRGEGIERYYLDFYGVSDSLVSSAWVHPLAVALAWLGLVGCWAVALGLLIRPLRSYLMGVAVGLEVAVYLLWSPTYHDSCFTLMMLALLLSCLPPARTHQAISLALGGGATPTPAAKPEPNAEQPKPKPRLWAPLLAFALVLIWSNVPPYRMQINHAKFGLFAWHWKLYRHGGAEICDVRYFDMHKRGAPIQRWKLLGYARPGLMPDKLARTHYKDLRQDYARVCDAMREQGDAKPHVQVAAQCGFKAGWKPVAKRKSNACKNKKGKAK
jgi:uncharacterized membrane protein YphA (DoxX/SURF4 family)